MVPGVSGSLVTRAYVHEALFSSFEGRLGEASFRHGLRAIGKCVRNAERRVGPASSARAVLDIAILPLVAALGYDVDRMDPLPGRGFIGVLRHEGAPAAVVLALPWGAVLDDSRRVAIAESPRRGASWAIVCNGASLSILDASRSWSRRWLEFDIAKALVDEQSARLLWALARADALTERDGKQSLIDDVMQASDRHATAVCTSLGSGVMDALEQLVVALGGTRPRHRRDAPDVVFEQSITVVYRILFLLFAEARALVPTWHRVYHEAYTIERLCRRVSAGADHRGAWSTLQAIARLAHAGCAAGDLRVTAFNGRLFAPDRSPLAERARVPDRVAGRVLLSLAMRREGAAQRPIAYGDLGVEQLGSVYERVLEYEPVEETKRLALRRTAVERKSTGTFYTPRSLTDFIVRRTLAPLVRGRTVDEILSLRIADPAMGSGAFLVSACRYLAGACEHALAAERSAAVGVTDEERAVLRRRVAERCLYGVDINPMAVQVARLSLWLTTLAADRPLTFLDHHLAVGDSLVGARFRDLARQPPFVTRVRRDRPFRTDCLFAETETVDALATSILPERFRLALEPGDTAAAVRDKEKRLAALDAPGTPLDRWKRAADLWCAAWFWTGRPLSPALVGDLTARVLGRESSLRPTEATAWLDRAHDIAQSLGTFHWELAFPEVYFDVSGRPRPDGGFDAVLGNPPWDVLRADEGADERRMEDRPSIQMLTRFVRHAGIYTSAGRGHPNRYQLFVERTLQQVRPSGRFGLLVPGGLMTDQRSGGLRRVLLDSTTLDAIVGFENRAGVFPIHRSMRFAMLVGQQGGSTPRLRCRFGLTDPSTLDDLPDLAEHDPREWSPIRIDRALLERWDPEHLTIPEVTDPLDLSILADVGRRVPALGSPHGWHVRFGRELNATDDAAHFVGVATLIDRADGLPVVEGKCLEPFRARLDLVRSILPAHRAAAVGARASASDRPRLAYRDVASATNKLTLIAAMLPAGCVSTHTVFCVKTALDEEAQLCLLGLLNSLVANYLVRRWVNAHVTTAVMARLPIPVPGVASPERTEIVQLTRALQRTGIDGDVHGYPRLNALVARLYGLDAERYAYIVRSFPLIHERVRTAIIDAF